MDTNPLHQKDIEYLKGEIQELKKFTSEGFTAIHLKLDVMSENFVRHPELQAFETLFEEKLKGITEKVNDLEDDKKWLVRVVMGIIVTAIVGLVITLRQ